MISCHSVEQTTNCDQIKTIKSSDILISLSLNPVPPLLPSPPCKQSPDIFGIDSPQVSFLSPSFPPYPQEPERLLQLAGPSWAGLGWDGGDSLR